MVARRHDGSKETLNKHYPPEFFDGLKNLPKLKVPKDQPCDTHYVAVHNEVFNLWRIYIQGQKIQCQNGSGQRGGVFGTKSVSFLHSLSKVSPDITYKTDPENEDYAP